MVTFLFWNLRGKPLQNYLSTLVREHDVDVLILAECEIDDFTLITTLTNYEPEEDKYEIKRIKIFTRFSREFIKPVYDDEYVAIRNIQLPTGNDVLLVASHLPSKLYQSDIDQSFFAARVAQLIKEMEELVGHSQTVVVGDLNMNPFESGVVSADAFHAVMSKAIALRNTRVVVGQERKFFYNPMWSRFGDGSLGPSGTYYYNSGTMVNYFWNIFDQVLLRPELLPFFNDDDLEILISVGDLSLLTAKGLPNARDFSDHLPILFRLSV